MSETPLAYLEVISGSNTGTVYPVAETAMLGRKRTNEIVVDDVSASRQHAQVFSTSTGFIIKDLGSSNGTYLNGEKIAEGILEDGDQIRIGDIEFVFCLDSLNPVPSSDTEEPTSSPSAPTRGVPLAGALEPILDAPTGSQSFPGNEGLQPVAHPSSQKGVEPVPQQPPPPSLGPLEKTQEMHRPQASLPLEEVDLEGDSDDEEQSQEVIKSLVNVEDHRLADALLDGDAGMELDRVRQRMNIIQDVSSQIGTLQNLDGLLQQVMDRLFEIFPAAERGYVLMKEPDSLRLKTTIVKRRSRKDTRELQISKTIVRKAITEKQAVLYSGQEQEFEDVVSLAKYDIHSMMCVPLVHQNDVLGIITIDTTRIGMEFVEDDLNLLIAIGAPIATALRNAQLLDEKETEAAIRSSLQRYFSPSLVEKIVDGGVSETLGGEMHEGLAFFCDIVGFTRMSSRIPAAQVVDLLNKYFDVMVEILFRHQGMIDKFSGDAIMAVWGAPESVEDGNWHAVQAALEMQSSLFEFNCGQIASHEETINMGVGLNFGEFIAGNMGAGQHEMVNYTIIGDDVNLAARIEAKAGPGQVFISESVYERVKEHVCAIVLPPTDLKGIPHPVTIYSIRALQDVEQPHEPSLLTSLPVRISAPDLDDVVGCIVALKGSNKDVMFDSDFTFDLICPNQIPVGQEIQCSFAMSELPDLSPVKALVTEICSRESPIAIPELHRLKFNKIPEVLEALLAPGNTVPSPATWEDLVR